MPGCISGCSLHPERQRRDWQKSLEVYTRKYGRTQRPHRRHSTNIAGHSQDLARLDSRWVLRLASQSGNKISARTSDRLWNRHLCDPYPSSWLYPVHNISDGLSRLPEQVGTLVNVVGLCVLEVWISVGPNEVAGDNNLRVVLFYPSSPRVHVTDLDIGATNDGRKHSTDIVNFLSQKAG
jgi:hypothetical protein